MTTELRPTTIAREELEAAISAEVEALEHKRDFDKARITANEHLEVIARLGISVDEIEGFYAAGSPNAKALASIKLRTDAIEEQARKNRDRERSHS